MKKVIFDKENPNGKIVEVEDIVIEREPTPEERLAALEQAMLDILIGGNANV